MPWKPDVVHGERARDRTADVIGKIRSRLGGLGGGPWKSKTALLVVAAIALAGSLSSYYQVEPDEVGVIRRLGKFVGTSDPGPHFSIPFGIDRVRTSPSSDSSRWSSGSGPMRRRPDRLRGPAAPSCARESLMLTGDLNVAVVEWIVQYKIKDPFAFLFRVRNVDETLASSPRRRCGRSSAITR